MISSQTFTKNTSKLDEPTAPASASDVLEFDHWEVRNSDGTSTALSDFKLRNAKGDITIYPYYRIKTGEGSLGLSGYDDDGDGIYDRYTVEAASGLSGDIVIPGNINGVPVTVITDLSSDFVNGDITSIEIKDGVQEIGSEAFAMTSGLKEVTIPASVTSIGSNAFSSIAGALVSKQITINYAGTWEQFQDACDENWERGLVTGTKVICADGTATLSATEYFLYYEYNWTFDAK